MSYEIGSKITVVFTVTNVDTDDETCYLEGKFGENLGWVAFETVDKFIEENNPELKRARIQKQIDDLQREIDNLPKQLEEIK